MLWYLLRRKLAAKKVFNAILPLNIFIHKSLPGHAISVMAVATNKKGEKLVLLSQGFMPAQDIHLLKNISDPNLDPWHRIEKNKSLITPKWVFEANELKRWK